jgi:hypothetical protein
MPNAPTRIYVDACEEAPVEVAFAVEFDVAIVLRAIVELLCSRDSKLELGIVTVRAVGMKIVGMETIVPRGADRGSSVGVDMAGSDMARGVTVMSETDIATASDVGIVFVCIGSSGMTRVLVLVLGTSGAEERIVKEGKVEALVGCCINPELLVLVG